MFLSHCDQYSHTISTRKWNSRFCTDRRTIYIVVSWFTMIHADFCYQKVSCESFEYTTGFQKLSWNIKMERERGIKGCDELAVNHDKLDSDRVQ